MVDGGKCVVISSSANRTPPIGEPNATAIPAALEAVSTSRSFSGGVSWGPHGHVRTLAADQAAQKVRHDVAHAASHVHRGPLLANAEPRGDRKRQADALDNQRPEPEELFHDEPRNHTLDLTDATASRVGRVRLD